MNISLTDKDDHYSILKKIASELKKQIERRHAVKTLAISALDFISRIEAAGVRFQRETHQTENDELFGLLQSDFVNLIEKLPNDIDGVVLLIDEAVKPPVSAGLGLICKALTEELTKRSCDRLCIGLAGLPNLIDVLRASHESSPRIFKTMTLDPLEKYECEQVIDSGIREAVERNGVEITITDDARAMIASMSEGYPHSLQEFAYCAFEQDSDNLIDTQDVFDSLYRENGAFESAWPKIFLSLLFHAQFRRLSHSPEYHGRASRRMDQTRYVDSRKRSERRHSGQCVARAEREGFNHPRFFKAWALSPSNKIVCSVDTRGA